MFLFQQPHVIHPKIEELSRRLHKWFFKQHKDKVENPKVLIVCATKCRYLFMKLCRELSKPLVPFKEGKIQPLSVVVDVDRLNKADVLQAFEK